MKVTKQVPSAFQPIVMVLETEEEINLVASALLRNSNSGDDKKSKHMYDQLRGVTSAKS